MARGQSQTRKKVEYGENLLEENEEVAEMLLDNGEAYSSIRERRNLEKPYEELEAEEKWWYALEVLENRTGQHYSSPREVIADLKEKEISGDTSPWNSYTWDSYEDNEKNAEIVVEEPFAAKLDDGRTAARVEAFLDGRRDEGFLYRIIDPEGDWEEHMS